MQPRVVGIELFMCLIAHGDHEARQRGDFVERAWCGPFRTEPCTLRCRDRSGMDLLGRVRARRERCGLRYLFPDRGGKLATR